jgi:hypothetical protein
MFVQGWVFGDKLFYFIDILFPIFPKDLNIFFTTLQFYLNYYAIHVTSYELMMNNMHILTLKSSYNILHKLKIL